ncbi:MAG: hypothetical protein PHF76_11970 [Bacteroidales bacterium]|nr:hypothetical protein [Bacteroidales bacterium]
MNETAENTYTRNRKDRRYKLLAVDIEAIMELLFPIGRSNTISKIKLPEDVHPITVQYSLDRQSFLFLLESENFPLVNPGEEIPYLDSESWGVARHQVILEDN